MFKKNWQKEIARDIIAMGSIVFYFLVVGRALVGPFWIFLTFLCLSAIILLLIYFVHREFESYLARGIILAIGTSYFYGDIIFTLFAAAVYILMVLSSFFLENSILNIIKGIIFGLISTGAGYIAVEIFFSKPWY
jgi:hypothetical protein